MFSKISAFILKILGWKVKAQYPVTELKKYIVIVAPHTSSWDFPLGLLVRSKMKIDVKFIGKQSLFRPPFGFIFKWLGGYPVDRSKKTNMVESIVQIYDQKEDFAICITPEGTRKKAERLKTGFYYIAKGAGIPIIMCKLDYADKVVTFSRPFYPSDDKDADFEVILDYFRGVRGKRPELGIS